MRACAFNREAASLQGINVSRMLALSFALSAGLGAIAGVLITPTQYTAFNVGVPFAISGFIAAIVGGFGHPLGAFMGGIMLGLAQSIAIVAFGAGLEERGRAVGAADLSFYPAGGHPRRSQITESVMDLHKIDWENIPWEPVREGIVRKAFSGNWRDAGAAQAHAEARAEAAQAHLRADSSTSSRATSVSTSATRASCSAPAACCKSRRTSCIGARWSATSRCSISISSRRCGRNMPPRHDRAEFDRSRDRRMTGDRIRVRQLCRNHRSRSGEQHLSRLPVPRRAVFCFRSVRSVRSVRLDGLRARHWQVRRPDLMARERRARAGKRPTDIRNEAMVWREVRADAGSPARRRRRAGSSWRRRRAGRGR